MYLQSTDREESGMKIKAVLVKVRGAIARAEKKLLAKVAIATHLSYYGLVGMEAHGNYRYAAIVIAVLMVAEIATNAKEVA
jgi:hypothetical protein